MEDTEEGENGDSNSKPGRSDASCDLDATYNPDDEDELTYSEGSVHGTFEVERHSGGGPDNGNSTKFIFLDVECNFKLQVETLKENPNAVYRNSNSDIRWKLWEAFAKSYTNLPEKNPNHSAQAYFGYHEANHSKLERLAGIKHLNKRMPIATSSVHSQIGMKRTAATKVKPTISKRPFVEDQRSGRPEKKGRFSQQALKVSFPRQSSDSDDWLDRLANPTYMLSHYCGSKEKFRLT
ncbi:hypothetical protein FS837_003171 [Tulasnella sp. UAMH 9824]|nr:hypothetical protein FS837_003171 [Tulasnella sp. UAMH 9824]